MVDSIALAMVCSALAMVFDSSEFKPTLKEHKSKQVNQLCHEPRSSENSLRSRSSGQHMNSAPLFGCRYTFYFQFLPFLVSWFSTFERFGVFNS